MSTDPAQANAVTPDGPITDPASKSMDELVSLCKRRGFVFGASEIYGGINGFWDYGPLGTQLKNNLRDAWWEAMVLNPPPGPDGERLQIVGLDSSIIQNPKAWEASGHVGGFNDPMVDDKETKQRFRADHFYGVFVQPEPTSVDNLDERGRAFKEKVNSGWAVLPVMGIVASGHAEAEAYFSDHLKSLCKAAKIPFGNLERPTRGAIDFILRGKTDSVLLIEIKQIEPSRLNAADQRRGIPSPFSQQAGTLTEPRMFNLMFETYVGAIRDEDAKAYLRPETAQGIFLNFKNVMDTSRVRVPFGIAQVGKAFRNEVTPRNFIFRSREFEQMEMEWFCHPDDAEKWYAFWRDARLNWWKSIGLGDDNLMLREHDRDELAHYAKEGAGTADVEYRYPFSAPEFDELEGIAHRSNYDLTQHQTHSKSKLEYFDQERNERYLPDVIEPAAGLTRGVLALLCEAFTPDPTRPSGVVMKFHPTMAPIKAAVYPLVNKDGMPEIAGKLAADVRARFGRHGFIESDPKQSIGKRYARMDEAGCPFCFTVDSDTLSDQTVTVRDRDTASQERINIDRVVEFLTEKLAGQQ